MMVAPKHKQAYQQRSMPAMCVRMLAQKPWWENGWLSASQSMSLASVLKGRGVIQLLCLPDSRENPCPNVGQGSQGDGMALALSSFALIILPGPIFQVGALPGKLLQGIAPGFDAAQPAMRFLVCPALEEDRRGAGERLQAACALIAVPIIAQFSKHARSETFTGSRQRLEKLVVLMHQKKALDLLIIVSNLLEQRFQLVYQC